MHSRAAVGHLSGPVGGVLLQQQPHDLISAHSVGVRVHPEHAQEALPQVRRGPRRELVLQQVRVSITGGAHSRPLGLRLSLGHQLQPRPEQAAQLRRCFLFLQLLVVCNQIIIKGVYIIIAL